MVDTFTLSTDAETIIMPLPERNYASVLHLSMIPSKCHCAFKFFDNGAQYDYRTFPIARHWLTEARGANLAAFLRSASGGRCNDITMSLGETATGFFPFGPDLGDKGDFIVRITDAFGGGISAEYYRHFEAGIALKLVSAPAYTYPSPKYEGPMVISGMSGYRFPQSQFVPDVEYAYEQNITAGGGISEIDMGRNADLITTEFDIETCQVNAANLIGMLKTVRSGNITIVTPPHWWLGGANLGGNGTYTCMNIMQTIKFKHERHDYFVIPMKLWIKSVT